MDSIVIHIASKHCTCARFMAQSAQVFDLTDPDENDKIRNELIDHFQNRRPYWSFIRPLGDGECCRHTRERTKSIFTWAAYGGEKGEKWRSAKGIVEERDRVLDGKESPLRILMFLC